MLRAVNRERARYGRPPLCLNYKLNRAAMRHSNDQAKNNFDGHRGGKSGRVHFAAVCIGKHKNLSDQSNFTEMKVD